MTNIPSPLRGEGRVRVNSFSVVARSRTGVSPVYSNWENSKNPKTSTN